MSSTKIWHNPRCSKSRQTLALLEERGIKPEVILYKEASPTVEEIREVLAALGKKPLALIRQKDTAFKELNMENASDEDLISAMATHPAIIERPVVQHGGKAALGRPPESVLKLFE